MATRKKTNPQPKQIVYLLGAGATQAEVNYAGAAAVNLLMRDDEELGGEGLSTTILKKLGDKGTPFVQAGRSMDVEKLISLLVTSGVDSQVQLAEQMRRLYFEEMCRRLVKAKIVRNPRLAKALLQMHHDEKFRAEVEQLSGVFTTNHDGLLQLAFESVYGAVDVGFPFVSDDITSAKPEAVPRLLQLHGSFSWKFGVPLHVATLRRGVKYSRKTVWIPPSVLKESKNYPFNKISAIAYEILAKRCDVLRIVGSSLTQNDWNILCLIFNAQRHRELVRERSFLIQLIMSRRSGKEIQTSCSYLKNTLPINALSEGDFSLYEEGLPADPELNNVFAYWLKEKINYHVRRREFDTLPLTGAMAEISGRA